jgi:hypothetical protein
MPPGDFDIMGPDRIYRGTTPTFTATGVADPDGDSVTVQWAVMKVCAPGMPILADCTPCDAPAGSLRNESNWPRPEQGPPAAQYQVASDFTVTDEPFCVWAFAVDSKGAFRSSL